MGSDGAHAELSLTECQKVRDAHGAFGRTLCQRTLDDENAGHLQFALSAMWLNERLDEANGRLRQAYDEILGGASEMTPELAGAEPVKWSMRMWLRIYYLFSSHGRATASYIEPGVEACLAELFWNYGCAKSTIERAQLKYVWHIQGSENHDMMDLSNAFLALQAVSQLPGYQSRSLPDGQTPAQHTQAWTAYYERYCEERAKHGLFVEIDSPTYGKWFLPELVNLSEFAEDAMLRRKAEMLLDLVWADWAVEQLGGTRGGGKTRCYHGKYAQRGSASSWRLMGRILTGQGDWFDAKGGQANYVLGTTNYRLPDVVIDLALDTEGRGEYVYRSSRPAKMDRRAAQGCPPLRPGPWYVLDTKDPRLVRYTYCTPDYILGSIWVDPALGVAHRPDENGGEAYAAISAQNRWQGIVFRTSPDARVYPQCIGEAHGDHTPTFNQHLAVQHENVMIVGKNPYASHTLPGMRVFFSDGMKERLARRDGWLFLEEGGAFLAVRVLSMEGPEEPFEWDDGNWLRLINEYAPVVFVAGRSSAHTNLEGFMEYVGTHIWTSDEAGISYRFEDRSGEDCVLHMGLGDGSLPEVDGRPISLRVPRVYDCPYLFREGKSITVRMHRRKLTLDFHTGTVTTLCPFAGTATRP